LGSLWAVSLAPYLEGCLVVLPAGSLGEQIDDKVLDNYQCLECGYSFSINR